MGMLLHLNVDIGRSEKYLSRNALSLVAPTDKTGVA
jgi:hypothetical protein